MVPKNQSAYTLSGAVSAVYTLCEKIFAQIPEHSQHGNDYSMAEVMVITGGI